MEGTLAIIASCTLKLQDKPFSIFDGLIFFEKEEDAFYMVDKIKALKESRLLEPASLEFFDKNALSFLKNEYAFIPDSTAALYFEQEVEKESDYDVLLKRWAELIDESGALTAQTILGESAKEREKIFALRHRLPQLINEFLRQHNQLKQASDIAVPWQNFNRMYNFYKEIGKSCGIDYVNFGHIGESHLHFNFLPKNDPEADKAKKYLMLFCEKSISFGGTVSAEHGIGKIKRPYLKIMYSQSQIKDMVALKKYFDPQCLLGLDNIFEKELLLD
jgi:D-lactate dehydrogenase (cytochrome)